MSDQELAAFGMAVANCMVQMLDQQARENKKRPKNKRKTPDDLLPQLHIVVVGLVKGWSTDLNGLYTESMANWSRADDILKAASPQYAEQMRTSVSQAGHLAGTLPKSEQ